MRDQGLTGPATPHGAPAGRSDAFASTARVDEQRRAREARRVRAGRLLAFGAQAVARGTAAAALLVAALVICGWITRSRALTSFTVGGPAMAPNVAFAVALAAAAALALTTAGGTGTWAARAIVAAGVLVAALALATLVERASGWRMGVDELVLHTGRATRWPGRMAPSTACGLAVLGLGIVALARGRAEVVQGLSVAVASVSFFAILGYASDVPALYDIAGQANMSLPAALSLLLLAESLFHVAPDRGMAARLWRVGPGGAFLRRGLPVAIMIPAVLGVLRVEAGRAGLDVYAGTWLLVATTIVMLTIATVMSAVGQDRAHSAYVAQEGRLQVAQERLAAAVETMADPFAIYGQAPEGAGARALPSDAEYRNDAARTTRAPHGALTTADGRPYDLGAALRSVGATGAALSVDRVREARADTGRTLDIRAARLPGGTVALTWRDVSAQVALEHEVRRSQQMLHGIIESASAAISVRDLDQRYLLVNPAYEQAVGRTFAQLRSATLPPAHPVAAALHQGQPGESEDRIVIDGQERVFLTVRFPLLDEHGAHYAVGGVSTEITSIRRAEALQRTFSQELEQRVADRTQELETRTLALAAANHELEAFSYSVSHDLRGPLRAIDGFSRLVLEEHAGILPDDACRDLQRVRAASQRMGCLIDELLELSRVTRRPMHLEQISMSEVAHDVYDEICRVDDPPVARLDVQPGLQASGDRALVRTVLQNLISNAAKFSTGSDRPMIAVGRVPDAGEPVYFVRDNGVGFELAHAEKLFRPFERLHTQAQFPGNGVGLATVQRVVHRHGGRIWAEARPGVGATFFFTLSADHGSTTESTDG